MHSTLAILVTLVSCVLSNTKARLISSNAFEVIPLETSLQTMNYTIQITYSGVQASDDCVLLCLTSPVACHAAYFEKQYKNCHILKSPTHMMNSGWTLVVDSLQYPMEPVIQHNTDVQSPVSSKSPTVLTTVTQNASDSIQTSVTNICPNITAEFAKDQLLYAALSVAVTNTIHSTGDKMQSTSGILMSSKNLSADANIFRDCLTTADDTTFKLETSTATVTSTSEAMTNSITTSADTADSTIAGQANKVTSTISETTVALDEMTITEEEDSTTPIITTVKFVPPTTPVVTTENLIWHASGTCGKSDCDCTFDKYFDIPTDSTPFTVEGNYGCDGKCATPWPCCALSKCVSKKDCTSDIITKKICTCSYVSPNEVSCNWG